MNGVITTFRLYVGLGAAAIGGYFLLPSMAQNLAFIASNLIAAIAVLVCVRRKGLRPLSGWLLVAAFPVATGLGNVVYFVNDSILGVSPFPSIGDAAFLGGYVLLAAGLLRLQSARSTRRDLPALLDTAIITVGFAAASWVVFMAPLLHDEETPLLERLVALGYPVADVLVLAVAARFFLIAHRRSPVFGWVAGTVAAMLVGDTVFAVLHLVDGYQTGHPVDALLLAYNLGWGAVALHPRAGDLVTSPPQHHGRAGWRRLAALCVASLIAPAVLIVQVVTGHLQDLIVTAAAAAVLFLLVVCRIAGLVVQVERVLAQRSALEDELQFRAAHDELTGLANRREFTDRLERSLGQRPDGGSTVLYLDLDRFKAVNDSLGHVAGDELLKVIADRLRGVLPAEDTIARLGGDEFGVLFAEQPTSELLETRMSDLAMAARTPVRLHGLDVQVGVSIGSAVAQPGQTLEQLLQSADHAMYTKKTSVERRANRSAPLAQPFEAESGTG